MWRVLLLEEMREESVYRCTGGTRKTRRENVYDGSREEGKQQDNQEAKERKHCKHALTYVLWTLAKVGNLRVRQVITCHILQRNKQKRVERRVSAVYRFGAQIHFICNEHDGDPCRCRLDEARIRQNAYFRYPNFSNCIGSVCGSWFDAVVVP
jgi:hypothetical protein